MDFLIPLVVLVVIVVGASKISAAIKTNQTVTAKARMIVWFAAILGPLIAAYLVELVYRGGNPLEVTYVCYILAHVIGLPLSFAQFIDELGCRIIGTLIGLYVVRRLVLRYFTQQQSTGA